MCNSEQHQPHTCSPLHVDRDNPLSRFPASMGKPDATDDNDGEQSPKEVDTSETSDPDLSAKLLNEFHAKASLKSHRSCISEMFLDYKMGQMTRDCLPRFIHWDFIETNGRFRIVEQLSLVHRLSLTGIY
ncbi:hypothetical protein NE237_002187 [Protea cynaroides]|uniref:Uncharacterized protein n=1 Tax=Protea cynaroides TaxID=273540 RepID=A0A9Q0KUS2_9MAGN|nr:hypothetical protein NE237_002187 [Protea cynaroides]